MAIASAWFTDHGGWLRQRAVKVLGPEHADDSLQNLFFKVLRRGRLAEVEEPEKYLTRAQSRVFATHWSRRCRVEVPVEDAAVEDSDSAGLGERLERMQDAELLRRCLPLLKSRHRAVLELQMSGMSREAIARELGLSPHAVTQLTRRALDALDHKLKQNGYLRGLVPVPLAGWIRDKVRASADFLSRYARTFEGLVPLTVISVVSILPAGFAHNGDIPSQHGVSAASARRPTLGGVTPTIAISNDSPRAGVKDSAGTPRKSAVKVEQDGTQVWVEGSHQERAEPPIEKQVADFVNDPGRAFPDCPTNLPCPWGDS